MCLLSGNVLMGQCMCRFYLEVDDDIGGCDEHDPTKIGKVRVTSTPG
jgi:hypothetical protein